MRSVRYSAAINESRIEQSGRPCRGRSFDGAIGRRLTSDDASPELPDVIRLLALAPGAGANQYTVLALAQGRDDAVAAPDNLLSVDIVTADVNTGDSDTLGHGTSFSLNAVPLSFDSCRRFSETAIVRFGRCAARRLAT